MNYVPPLNTVNSAINTLCFRSSSPYIVSLLIVLAQFVTLLVLTSLNGFSSLQLMKENSKTYKQIRYISKLGVTYLSLSTLLSLIHNIILVSGETGSFPLVRANIMLIILMIPFIILFILFSKNAYDEEKSVDDVKKYQDKAKNIIFGFIPVSVLLVIIFIIYSVLLRVMINKCRITGLV